MIIAAAALGLAGGAAVFAVAVRPVCLVVRDEAQEVVLVARLPAEGFALRFRHSVTREPVWEYLRPAPGEELMLYATAFGGGGGAGLPFDEPGAQVSIEGDRVVMRGLDRRFPAVSLRPLPLTEHRLLVGRRDCDLLALAGKGRTVLLSAERRPALEPAWRRLRNPASRGECREREGP